MAYKIYPIFLAFTLLMSTSCVIMENVNREQRNMMKTVEPMVQAFIHEIPEAYLLHFGIRNYDEVENAELGTPVRVYTLENDSLVFTNTWRVAYISENEHKALLTLTRDVDGTYEVVDFGAKILAEELANASQIKQVKGLLRVYELQKDFFFLQDNNRNTEFHPIPDDGDRTFTLDEIIQMKWD